MIYTPENTSRMATVYFVPKQGIKYKLRKCLSICTTTNTVKILTEPVSYDEKTEMFNTWTLYCSSILVVRIQPYLPELFILFE